MNTLHSILTEIATAMTALTAGDTPPLRRFKRGVFNPLTAVELPRMGMVIDVARRRVGADWTIPVLLPIAVDQGAGDPAEAITDILIEVDAALTAWQDSNRTGGGSIDLFEFEPWYSPRAEDPSAPCGAIFRFQLKLEGPLKGS